MLVTRITEEAQLIPACILVGTFSCLTPLQFLSPGDSSLACHGPTHWWPNSFGSTL